MKKVGLMFLAGLVCLITSLHGALLYWDTNDDEAGFGESVDGVWGVDSYWSSSVQGVTEPDTVDTTSADDLFFGSTILGLGSGTITVGGTMAQSFSSLTFGPFAGAIRIEGGELEVAEPESVINIAGSGHVIASALVGSGGLSVATPPNDRVEGHPFLTKVDQVIFENANLSDFVGARAYTGGKNILEVWANGYHFSNDGTTATVQFQMYDGNHNKCVKVELTQDGSNIKARSVYARYRTAGNQVGKINFDVDSVSESIVATSPTADGYGIAQVELLGVRTILNGFVETGARLILPNVSLADITTVEGMMDGKSVSSGPVPTTPYYFQNDGEICTVQLQALNGGYVKCVKLELAQIDEGVTVRGVYSKVDIAGGNNIALLGSNFDDKGSEKPLALSPSQEDYGICRLRFPSLELSGFQQTLELQGANTYSGATTIDEDTRLVLGGDGLLGGGSYSGAIVNDYELVFAGDQDQVLSGEISGAGRLVKDGGTKMSYTLTHSGYLRKFATSKPSTTFDELVQVSECVGMSGILGGAGIPEAKGDTTATTYFFENLGYMATAQLQVYHDGHTKCVKVALVPSGIGIRGCLLYAKYLLNQNALGTNFDPLPNNGSMAENSELNGGYGVTELTIDVERYANLTLEMYDPNKNSYANGTVVRAGTLHVTGATTYALPEVGGITVEEDGCLLLSAYKQGDGNGIGRKNPIIVNGGKLVLANTFVIGNERREVIINGGMMLASTNTNNDANSYINNLTLRNGGKSYVRVRTGTSQSPRIKVDGNAPGLLAEGINLVKNESDAPLLLDVEDVTGDAEADLVIGGTIRDYDDKLKGSAIHKEGAGTVALDAVNTAIAEYTIAEGSVRLGVNGALKSVNNVVLAGGGLESGTAVNSAGTLSVTASSGLVVGSGSISFSDSSGESWEAGALLNVSGELGSESVRFGTNSSGLSVAQLAAVRINGQGGVRLTEEGYLVPPPAGTMIMVR